MLQEKKHANKLPRFIIIVLLSLLILLSGITLLVFKTRENPQGNVQGNHPKSATKIPTPTASATLTPQPLFVDNFLDNKKGWYTGSVDGYARSLDSNGLTLTDTNHKVLTESLPTNQLFDNVIITTTFTLQNADKNDSVGLYIRGDSNLDHDYRIELFGNNMYAISKESLDATNHPQITYLAGPTHTAALKTTGQQNTLVITMNGAVLTLQINGVLVNTVIDDDYTRGQIALFVANGTTSSGVTALFSSISVYPTGSRAPK